MAVLLGELVKLSKIFGVNFSTLCYTVYFTNPSCAGVELSRNKRELTWEVDENDGIMDPTLELRQVRESQVEGGGEVSEVVPVVSLFAGMSWGQCQRRREKCGGTHHR